MQVLIIMDTKMNISSLLPDNPSSTLRDILVEAHCPSHDRTIYLSGRTKISSSLYDGSAL
jgi:hypothetical protein